MLHPAAFVLAVALSAWTLADARRGGLRAYAVVAWTLLTLFAPHIVFPLYLVARRLFTRRLQTVEPSSSAEASAAPAASDEFVTAETAADAPETERLTSGSPPPPRWHRALPLLYAAVALSLAALFFVRDYRSLDARLARAEKAKVLQQTGRAIREYRAALKLADDPHTRKLLAVELAGAGRTEEALAEFLAAERGGEPDERLAYHIAGALDALDRPAEAEAYYRKFLDVSACTRPPPDGRCAKAQMRLKYFSGG